MSRVQQSRHNRRRQVDRFQLYKPFVFYTGVLLVLQAAVLRSEAPSPTFAGALFAAGLLSWGLVEYVVHRWVLHRIPRAQGFNLPGNLTHLRHHDDPQSLQRLNVQLSESLQHANLRLSFGAIGERLWISPRFHRLHHSIGIGHESHGPKTLGGHNFGVLLPWWDMLFRTVNFEDRYHPTGIRDQVEPDDRGLVKNYGRGFWSQQWLGLRRLVGRD